MNGDQPSPMPAFDMSPAAQITDDFVHRRSRQRWAKTSRATHFVGTADLPQEADPPGQRSVRPSWAICSAAARTVALKARRVSEMVARWPAFFDALHSALDPDRPSPAGHPVAGRREAPGPDQSQAAGASCVGMPFIMGSV